MASNDSMNILYVFPRIDFELSLAQEGNYPRFYLVILSWRCTVLHFFYHVPLMKSIIEPVLFVLVHKTLLSPVSTYKRISSQILCVPQGIEWPPKAFFYLQHRNSTFICQNLSCFSLASSNQSSNATSKCSNRNVAPQVVTVDINLY